MGSKLFQNKYRIASARAPWHSYNNGMYFVTICTAERMHYFGEICNGKIILSEIGKYLQNCITSIKQHYPDCEIPLYVIMPNHLHIIISINKYKQAVKNTTVETDNRTDVKTYRCTTVETEHAPSLQPKQPKPQQPIKNAKMQSISQQKGRLAKIIGSIKSATTQYANRNNIPFQWQTRYHDHIIRNKNTYNHIVYYIKNNVTKWEKDKFNTK